MTKLEELLNEYCPNGVEYKPLGELGYFYGGLTGKCKNDFVDGNAKFITYMNVYSNPALDLNIEDTVKVEDKEKQNLVEYGDVLFTGSSETPDECGMSSVVNQKVEGKLYLNSFCFGFRLNDKNLFEPDFLKHLFRAEELRKQIFKTASGVTRFNVSKNKFAKLQVPVPPLVAQREIVRILDNFTLYLAELTAELTARRKQYEFYRDSLLTFDKNVQQGGANNPVQWKKLGDCILSLHTGLNPRKFFKLNTDDAKNYYVTIREMINGEIVFSERTDRINDDAMNLCNKRSDLEIGDVLFSGTGTIGETVVIKEAPVNWNIKEGVYAIKPNAKILNASYLSYLLNVGYIKVMYMKKVAGGTVKSIPMADLNNFEIPIPPLAEQERIVAILDKFDALCNDITAGLPAEIEMRKKQYEYYRDKLLTFKKSPVTSCQPL